MDTVTIKGISSKIQKQIMAEIKAIVGTTPTVENINGILLFVLKDMTKPPRGMSEIEEEIKDVLDKHLEPDQILRVGVKYSYNL